MSSVTLDFVANVTQEQMDSTQKIKMIAFHSPFGLGVIQLVSKKMQSFTSWTL